MKSKRVKNTMQNIENNGKKYCWRGVNTSFSEVRGENVFYQLKYRLLVDWKHTRTRYSTSNTENTF
jgi:hypothetical protein